MTSIRFVGDLPLWIGLLLAVAVGMMSWRFYSRESFDLPRRLRWLLPLLRSTAFFLGIMVLTGPVLHHRTIIGELGRVTIYLDSSRSMSMQDRHMSIGRKLVIAEQLGWLTAGQVDSTLLKLADKVAEARQRFVLTTAPTAQSDAQSSDSTIGADGTDATDAIRQAVQLMQQRLTELSIQFAPSIEDQFNTELLPALDSVSAVNEGESTELANRLTVVIETCRRMESAIRQQFETTVTEMVKMGDESVRSALAMFDETPRWRRMEQALIGSSAHVLSRLRERHDVQVLDLSGEEITALMYAAEADSFVTTGAGESAFSEPVFSETTDLSSGIAGTQPTVNASPDSEHSTSPAKSAIVVVTDGQHNSGPSPVQLARVLGSQGTAIFSVSMGATQQAADLAVLSVEYPETVFRKDRVRGTVHIRDRMPPGRPFVAQVRAGGNVLWQQQLVTQDVGERRVEFEISIDQLVEQTGSQFSSDLKLHAIPLELEAAITPLPEETETSNNLAIMRLAAIVQSYKVLLLDGRSRWETRYLRNAFDRDEQWSINTVIAGPGTDNTTLPRGDGDARFPATRDKLFEYDVVVFGEIDPNLLAESEFQWLREFVELRGGGFVFIDGQRGFLRQLTEQNLARMLPIEWISDATVLQQESLQPLTLQLTDKGASLSALMLKGETTENRQFWSELPGPHSIVSVEALPGSEVLVEVFMGSANNTAAGTNSEVALVNTRPAIVTRNYGAGRILYLAFDETWRWRYKAADTWHQRIWNQLARYVMPRPFAVSDEYLSVDTGPISYKSDQTVDVRIRVNGLDGKPLVGVTADALIWKDDRIVDTISLRADSEVPGIYRGTSAPMTEGAYTVSIQAAGFSASALKARSSFVVLPPESGEMIQTSVNEALLQQIAAESSGVYLREEQISTLPELLNPLSKGRVVESDTLIWQSYWWFTAMVLLLTVEWVLRKRAGLL